MFEELKKEREQWIRQKEEMAENEPHQYSYERNPDYMKDPTFKSEKQQLQDMQAFLSSVKEYKEESPSQEQGYTRTRTISNKFNNVGSSIIVSILVTVVVATAGILTAILMLK